MSLIMPPLGAGLYRRLFNYGQINQKEGFSQEARRVQAKGSSPALPSNRLCQKDGENSRQGRPFESKSPKRKRE